ncbi:hypothetical protein ABZZ36_31790, partial [Actinacidiphila glaucinigra]
MVWLNEAQHYFGDPRTGERIAAAVHSLLTTSERRPVLILGTLWPQYAESYSALPTPGSLDPYSRVRELLAGRTVIIPDAFDQEALRTAVSYAQEGDVLLADSLTRTGSDGHVTQDLAGAPALLERYDLARPTAKAVLNAAIDARRLGASLDLPHAFLTAAAEGYLTDRDYGELTDDWSEAAFTDLARLVHGRQTPLRRLTPRPQWRPPSGPMPSTLTTARAGRSFRLADYLEQHGRAVRRHICPPASFWQAAHTHLLQVGDLYEIALAARNRHRLQWAHDLLLRAADEGHPKALVEVAKSHAANDELQRAEELLQRAAQAGHTAALIQLAALRTGAGDQEGAEKLLQQAADNGNTHALVTLMRMREASGDPEGAEILYRKVSESGRTKRQVSLEKREDRTPADPNVQLTAANVHGRRFVSLVKRRDHRRGVGTLLRRAVDESHASALVDLARMREAAGDHDGAEAMLRRAADEG